MVKQQARRQHTCHPWWTADECVACREEDGTLLTRRDYLIIGGLTVALIGFWAGLGLLLIALGPIVAGLLP